MIDTKALLQIYEQEIIDSFKICDGEANSHAFYSCVMGIIADHHPDIAGVDPNIVYDMYSGLNGAK